MNSNRVFDIEQCQIPKHRIYTLTTFLPDLRD